MNRWYFLFIGLAIAAMFLLIWIDSRPDDTSSSERELKSHPLESTGHHSGFGETDEVYGDFHGNVDLNSPESINNRISEIEVRLAEMDPLSRQAVPFYGELMMLYQRLGRDDGASEASRHIAKIMNDPDDWWNAALLSYQWALQVSDSESQTFYLDRAERNFAEAMSLSDNPELHTDYAIVLYARNKNDKALEILENLIEKEKGTYLTFLYAGMILYQNDKKDESISYISKSVETANNQDEIDTIQAVTAGTTIEI